ncbi:MAG: hypothetical protein H0W72_02520 [Planctomycetes bacterium]|nr:hypothetical protein [Planctomycetota bacterium]
MSAYACRRIGAQRYRDAVAAREAAGVPTSIAAFVAAAPVVDAAAQEAWHEWSEGYLKDWSSLAYDRVGWNRWVAGRSACPHTVVDIVEGLRPRLVPACALLQGHQDLVLGLPGWAAVDLPPGRRAHADITRARSANLASSRDLVQWLRYEAVLAQDPIPALVLLEAAARAHAHPGTILDALIALRVGGLRDRAYLDLAVQGRLPDELAAPWLAEPAQAFTLIAAGFDGEVATHVAGWADVVAHLPAWASTDSANLFETSSRVGKVWRNFRIWTSGHQDCARVVEAYGGVADHLRGMSEIPIPSEAALTSRFGPLGCMIASNVIRSADSALAGDVDHRLVRLAVRLLAMARGDGLPLYAVDLENALGDITALRPGGGHLAIAYESLASNRFRLTAGTARSQPGQTGPQASPPDRTGRQPSPEPLTVIDGQVVEILTNSWTDL